MSLQGVNLYFTGLGLPYSIWQVYYPFSGQVGANLPSFSGANTGINATVQNGFLGAVSGVGHFSETLVRINGLTGNFNDWTLIFEFSKQSANDGVLFSSLTSGAINSGFVVGVTASNRIYAESYDEFGPVTYTADTILGNRSAVAVSKVGQSIYFDYFNANEKEVESQKYEVSDKAFVWSNNTTLGGSSNTPSYYTGKSFSGYMNNFMMFSPPLRPEEIKGIFKGLVVDVNSGIPSYNTGAVLSLGMNAIAYLEPFDTTDTVELLLVTGHPTFTGANWDADYDSVVGEFYAKDFIEQTGIQVFVNGISQLGLSGYSISGDFYDSVVIPSGNYIPTGMKIYANRAYDGEDRVIYDINPYSTESFGHYDLEFSHDGSSSVSITTRDSSLDAVYFNGVKLVLGQDYTATNSTTITFASGNSLYNGVTGSLWTGPIAPEYIRTLTVGTISGSYPNFGRGTSMFWLNGVRQNLDEFYVEIGSNDLLNGTGIFTEGDLLFDNDENFLVAL